MRTTVLLVPLGALLAVVVGVGAVGAGCAIESGDDDAVPSEDAGVADAAGDSQIQDIAVGDDTSPAGAFCGEEQLCDPDVPAICTALVTDAALDADAEASVDAAEVGPDANETGAGTTSACRVVHRDNGTIAACAPAGKVTERLFCASDDDCAPGLACVGPMGVGRCLRYCCAEYQAPTMLAPDGGPRTHYCALRPLAANAMDKVPVWVKLDNCTLLDDALQCDEGSTCAVVTNDGATTCVPVGAGRDYASCAEEPCDRGYVCLGSVDRRCRKLCKKSEGAAACPGGGYCEGTPTIPDGYGVCAGGSG